MTEFPWKHREGHMVARLVSESAETVTYDYQHVRVPSWKGRTTDLKGIFMRAFTLGDAA